MIQPNSVLQEPDENVGYSVSKYVVVPSLASTAFSQCEILTNVVVPLVVTPSIEGRTEGLQVQTVQLSYCMVMSQDCDLERHFKKEDSLRHILLCELEEVEKKIEDGLLDALQMKVKDVKKKLPTHPHPRYGFLEKINEDIPELIADFRLIYGIQPEFLDYQVQNRICQRVAKFKSPYKEHFSQRFYFYLNRVALPEQHSSL